MFEGQKVRLTERGVEIMNETAQGLGSPFRGVVLKVGAGDEGVLTQQEGEVWECRFANGCMWVSEVMVEYV